MNRRLLLSAIACLPFLASSAFAADDLAQQIESLAQDQKKADRLAALKSLRETEDPNAVKAIPALTRCMEDKDGEIRDDACWALAEIALKNKMACPLPVLEALLDPAAEVRTTAVTYVDVYKKYPDEARKLLLRAMNHEDSNVRSCAPTILARIASKDKEVLAVLRKATQDKDPIVRNNAVVAIYAITKELEPFVIHLVKSPDDLFELGDKQENETAEKKKSRSVTSLLALGAAAKLDELTKEQPADLALILIKLLADKSARIRARAARILGATAKSDRTDAFGGINPFALPNPTPTADRRAGSPHPESSHSPASSAPAPTPRDPRGCGRTRPVAVGLP